MSNCWWVVYAIMKTLNLTELEVDKKYFEISRDELEYMSFTEDIKNQKIKVELKEKQNETTI